MKQPSVLCRAVSILFLGLGEVPAETPSPPSATPSASDFGGPICEVFDSGPIPPGWTRVASDGTTVTVAEHWLACEASPDAKAHVKRPVPAGLQFPALSSNVRYLGSIYLVWDQDNWLALGKVSPTPFGRLYSTVRTAGKGEPVLHRGIDVGAPQWLRIQAGTDSVRFEYSFDRKAWHFLNAADRTAGMRGTPRLMAVGKYYPDAGRALLSESSEGATEDVNARSYSALANGYFRDVCLESTPAEARRLTEAEKLAVLRMSKSDPLGQEILARPGDPDFDSVAAVYPAMERTREIVGVPEHSLAVGINHRGELDNGPWAAPLGWVEVGETSTPLRDMGKLERRLLDGWIPVVTLKAKHNGAEYEQTLFGWSNEWSPGNDLFGYVRFRVSSPGGEAPQPAVLVNAAAGRRHPLTAESAESADYYFRYKHPDLSTVEQVSAQEYEGRLSESADRWRKLIAKIDRFELPDKRVADMLRASCSWALLNTDTVEGHPRVHDGSGFYDIVFGYSMSLHNNALDLYGLKEEAERRFASQLARQGPDGAYVQECGLPDQGSLLWGLGQHYLLTRDKEWLRKVADQYRRGCEWVIRQRGSAPREGLMRGLIKFRPYNDHPEPVFNYFGNSYCCLGLEVAAQAFADIGMTSESEHFAREGAAFRKDILDSMRSAVIEHDGVEMLPMEPDTHRLLKLSNYRGGDYYGLVASTLLETGFLPAHSREARLITDLIEQRKGLVLGMCEFMEGIDHAYTYGYWLNQQKLGEVEKVLLGLWGSLAYGMSRDTYSPVEVTYPPLGENHYTLPHTYSCTQQLRLVRNMLVLENGDTLNLAQAIPTDWTAPGKVVKVKDAPTRFGPVSYTLTGLQDGSVRVTLVPPARSAPRQIEIRLRRPGGALIKSLEKPAKVSAAWTDDTVTLPAGAEPVEFTAHFHNQRH